MNNNFKVISCGSSAILNTTQQAKVIATKADAPKVMINYNDKKIAEIKPAVEALNETVIPLETMESVNNGAPVEPVEAPINDNNIAGVPFQKTPDEINTVSLDIPSTNPTTIEPLNINNTEVKSINEVSVVTMNDINVLSDEMAIKKLNGILDEMGITSDFIRTGFILDFERNLNQYKLVKYLEDQKVENADIAKTAAEISKVNQQLVGNIQSVQPTRQTQNNDPVLNYQQAA